jgi:hypothetical protein
MEVEVRIPLQLPPEVKEGWVQLIAYVSDAAGQSLSGLALVTISHLPNEAKHKADD